MARLNLQFLGTPGASLKDQPIAFPTRKTFALLVYLVVEGGAHSREKLTTLLWPESDPQRGRRSLRRALAFLRQALGDAGTDRAPYILVERDTLAFYSESDVHLDLDSLDAAARLPLLGGDMNTPLAREKLDQMSAVAYQCQGEFLEGFSLSDAPEFDNWSSQHRERYHLRRDLVLDRLSEQQFQFGDVTAAIETCFRWIAHNKLNEAAHRRLMQLYLAAGQRAAALEAFETYRQTLQAELAIGPAPETEALAERIRAGLPSRPQPSSTTTPHEPPPGLEVPLVGRASEHVRLVERYYTARRGITQAMVLEGESGIGKTRLATEFLAWAASHGAEILHGQAMETGGGLPYQAVVEALRGRFTSKDFISQQMGEAWLAELSRLLPDLREAFPGLPPPLTDESTSQIRLFEATARLGEAIAAQAPLILFLDDIQWADPATLDLLHYTARRWAQSGVPAMLLISVRSEGLARSPSLVDLLSNIARALRTERLVLGPLTRDDTLQLVRGLTGSPDDRRAPGHSDAADAFGAWLYGETQGQPFFLVETLKALLQRGVLKRSLSPDGVWVIDLPTAAQRNASLERHIPKGVREVIRTRFAKLSPIALELLSACAVLGIAIDLGLACGVAGLEDDQALPALDELLKAYVLRERSDDGARSTKPPYEFAHDKIREVAYAEAGEARRGVFHQRALEALERRGAPAAELAYHALAAGVAEPAFHQTMAAGREAMSVFASSDAILHYTHALEILRENGFSIPSGEQLIQVFTGRGRALELADQHDSALENYQEMEAVALKRDDKRLALASVVAQATLRSVPGPLHDPVQGHSLADRVMALAGELGDLRAEAKGLWIQILLNVFLNRHREAIACGERSIALSKRLDLRDQLAYSLNDITRAYLGAGQIAQAAKAYEDSLELWRELGNLPMLADNLISSALISFVKGEFAETLTLQEEGHRICQSIDNRWGQAFGYMVKSFVHAERGDFRETIASLEEAAHISEQVGMNAVLACATAELGLMFTRLGAAQRGLELSRLTRHTLEDERLPAKFVSWALVDLARIEIQCGSLASAEATLKKSYAGYDEDDCTIPQLRFLPLTGAELALAKGNADRANAIARKVCDQLRRLEMRALLPEALLLQGRASLELGRRRGALKVLEEARAEAERMGARRTLWQILATLSRIESQRGNSARGERLRQQAIHIVIYLADSTASDELRASFLALPEVRAVMGHD